MIFVTNSYGTVYVLDSSHLVRNHESQFKTQQDLRDGSLFMGMTRSGKNQMGLEDFSFRGDELYVFFLNKEIEL